MLRFGLIYRVDKSIVFVISLSRVSFGSFDLNNLDTSLFIADIHVNIIQVIYFSKITL